MMSVSLYVLIETKQFLGSKSHIIFKETNISDPLQMVIGKKQFHIQCEFAKTNKLDLFSY